MRIGLSTSVIQRGQTGIGQHLFALLRALRLYTDRHEFFLFVLEGDRPLFAFVGDSMQLVQVPERFRPPIQDILWHQTELPRLARRFGLDVLHVPSYRRLLWRRPCALVATIHDLAPFHVAGKYDWLRMFYGRAVVRRLAHRQHEIIAVSQNTARDISAFFRIPEDRLHVVYNGVEHGRFFPGDLRQAQAAVAQRHGIESRFFFYVARLEHPAKNHVRLITAFNRFKAETGSDWKLVLGGSDWHGAEVIHEAIRRSPAVSDIACLGFVPDEDLPDLYRAAEAFVYPSLFEGFGLPPMEAMACGCPVISSRRGSLGEIMADAGVAVEPEDAEDLQNQLRRVAEDSDLRRRLRATGLARAQCFTWKRTAAETVAVYLRAVSRADRRAS